MFFIKLLIIPLKSMDHDELWLGLELMITILEGEVSELVGFQKGDFGLSGIKILEQTKNLFDELFDAEAFFYVSVKQMILGEGADE